MKKKRDKDGLRNKRFRSSLENRDDHCGAVAAGEKKKNLLHKCFKTRHAPRALYSRPVRVPREAKWLFERVTSVPYYTGSVTLAKYEFFVQPEPEIELTFIESLDCTI